MIKTSQGPQWLTIPVGKPEFDTPIDQVKLEESGWQKEHLERIRHAYSKAPFFNTYKTLLDQIYLEERWTSLSQFNQRTTKLIAKELGISTKFYNARDLNCAGSKELHLIEICKALNATSYLSGPSAKDYINEDAWKNQNIDLNWKNYTYPEYPQLYEPFTHNVTVLDLLLMVGPSAGKFIW